MNEDFKPYDPFRRQRKKRTGFSNDPIKLYQQDVDQPMIAKIVEAARRTERGAGELDDVRVEERAEWIDDRARSAASKALYRNIPFAPRDFAAEHRIDLAELSKDDNKRHPFDWALKGSEERDYRQANNAFGPRDYLDLMAIPEQRKVARAATSGSTFGQLQGGGETPNKITGQGMGALASAGTEAQTQGANSNTEQRTNIDNGALGKSEESTP